MKNVITILIIVFAFCYEGVAQNRSNLEKQKKELLTEIANIQNKLSSSKKEKKLILSNVEDVKNLFHFNILLLKQLISFLLH